MQRHTTVTQLSQQSWTRAAIAALLAASAFAPLATACPPVKDPQGTSVTTPQPVVRIALLLDTSNSMDGLIGQAKSQLWAIVNRFNQSCKGGAKPQLRIALYQYGNSTLSAESQYVQQVMPFTSDLDLLSERLFGLQTSGGSELCGPAIGRALADMDWGKRDADASFVFIAGNEPFDQAPYAEQIADAVRKGVRINTIFCGTRDEGIGGKWLDGATLGRGRYSVIDQGAAVPHVPSPYDDEISKLGIEVNTTYLAFGRDGEASKVRQERMDVAAREAAPAASIERAVTKNSRAYDNSVWDLVDAVTQKKVDLEKLDRDELPAMLADLSVAEQRTKIEELASRRAAINLRVQELNTKRDEFLKTQRATQAAPTLGDAMVQLITEQAQEEGFTFE
jgi:hypothetical protein